MRHVRACFAAAAFAALVATPAIGTPLTVQAKFATGTWSDGTTTGNARTEITEECNLEYVCTITADADTHVGASATHGVCTDTTASLGGRNIAAPFCRAVFRIQGLVTGGPQACDATTLGAMTKGSFTFTTSDGANYPIPGVELTIANGVATVQGAVVSASGQHVGSVDGTFTVRCASGIRYGSWSGTTRYAI